ncbi:MAG: hypothetical protein ABI333_20585, partial [bacterium]
MTRKFFLSLLLILTLLAPTGSVSADGSELHAIRRSPRYGGSPVQAARAFLTDRAGEYDLWEVTLVHKITLALGDFRTVRFVQQYEGLPVLRTGAAVRVAPNGRVTVAAFRVARMLVQSTVPLVTRGEVRTLLASHVGPWAAAGRIGFRLAVLPEEEGPGFLVWQVTVPTGKGGLRFLIDAHRGVMLDSRPLAIEALGRVYEISALTTPDPTDLELLDLDVAMPQMLNGWNGQLQVTNYLSGGEQSDIFAEQTLTPNVGEDFLYDPPVDPTDGTDGFAQVGLYYHLTRMRDYFATNMGVDFSPVSWNLTAIANMQDEGQPYDNAFFSEAGMAAPWNTNNLIAVGQGTD